MSCGVLLSRDKIFYCNECTARARASGNMAASLAMYERDQKRVADARRRRVSLGLEEAIETPRDAVCSPMTVEEVRERAAIIERLHEAGETSQARALAVDLFVDLLKEYEASGNSAAHEAVKVASRLQ